MWHVCVCSHVDCAHFSLMVSFFAQGRGSNECRWMMYDMNVAQVAQWELGCLG